MTARRLRIGTRGSALAVAQTQQIADRLQRSTGLETTLVRITTHGDVSRAALSSLGGTGVFASELREALLADECDLLVHSLKDLPTAAAPGLVIGAYPRREDARDALCSAGGADGARLAELPPGARVGTGSPRRVAQLLALRPDLRLQGLRGNVDTRLSHVERGELDAVVLASAGLERLGRTAAITERFELDLVPTAPGQGCLAIEVPRGAEVPGVAELDDPAARAAVLVERGVLAGLQAGCSAPVGATAGYLDGRLAGSATVYASDGSRLLAAARSVLVADSAAAPAAAARLGHELSQELLDRGAAELVAAA